MEIVAIDDQPINAGFFNAGSWLTDYITPKDLEVQKLYRVLTDEAVSSQERITACWRFVASNIRYTPFVRGRMWIDGQVSDQNDLWNLPAITRRVQIGNCANKSFLLTSLYLNEPSISKVYCVLGNLLNGGRNGHAWVEIEYGGIRYISETTRSDIPPLVPAALTERYEAVHFFNDKEVFAVEGRTLMEPFTACYSDWLRDYLDWAYIEGNRRQP